MTAAVPLPPSNGRVTPIEAAKAADAAKKQQPTAKAAPARKAKKARAKTAEKPARELSRVAPLPKPTKLEWQQKDDGSWTATSGRWRYRVQHGDKGWFASQATGTWTPLHADPQPVDMAKHIAEVVDAGAHWIGWARYRSLSWAEIEKVPAEAAKQ